MAREGSFQHFKLNGHRIAVCRDDKANRFVAICPALDAAAQGTTIDAAMEKIKVLVAFYNYDEPTMEQLTLFNSTFEIYSKDDLRVALQIDDDPLSAYVIKYIAKRMGETRESFIECARALGLGAAEA